MRLTWAVLAFVAVGCSCCRSTRSAMPANAQSESSAAGQPETGEVDSLGLSDGMGLRLPELGTSRALVAERVPECLQCPDTSRREFNFPADIRHSPRDPAGGSTWWTYRFRDELLDVAMLERVFVDADADCASGFAETAERVAEQLSRRFGPPSRVERAAPWSAIESSEEGTRLVLERRTWMLDRTLVTWTLSGEAAHHPIIRLLVRMETPRPDELQVEMLDSSIRTGEPFLRLRGGSVPHPFDVPLWLTCDACAHQDDHQRCIGNDAVVFQLPDGRVYVGQYNAYGEGPGPCRVVDPHTHEAAAPPAGCLWGEGMHHRATPVGDGVVLLTSSSEGVGWLSIVHYDPERGIRVELQTTFSATADLNPRVRDGGVDFSTPCDLPAGCGHRDYSDAPMREYRWTAERGLVEL